MASTDPAEDLVPCMRSVQLSDEDKQLMSAFKNKVDDAGQYGADRRPLYRGGHIPSRLFRELDNTVDGEAETYLHSEADPRYKGGHIPSRTFRILQAATGGGDGGVSGGAPPSGARIGGPGQNRTVMVHMPAGGASGPAVHPSQQEVPEPKKYTGGNIPSRSFKVLQQMTADEQGSVALQRPADGPPRRSPSHYAHGPEAAAHAPPPPRAAGAAPAAVPTCERIEREQQQQRREQAANARSAAGRNPPRAYQQLNGHADSSERRSAAVPSRSFRLLQQEYGTEEQEPAAQEQEQESGVARQEAAVIRTTPAQQKQRMAAVSRTYRLLQTDPAAAPSVLGRNGR